MSPRAAATRSDATALTFLHAAAQLFDASMLVGDSPHPRLRQIKFPAALDWIRVEDVLLVANQNAAQGFSKKAFLNRWPTRDEFLRDAVVFALLYRDQPLDTRPDPEMMRAAVGAASFAEGVTAIVDRVVGTLSAHPRSFLLCHIAPYLPQHPETAAYIRSAAAENQAVWTRAYAGVLAEQGLRPRPDWPVERISAALQCVLDGFVLRHRVQPELLADGRWQSASLMADTVLVFLAGALDFDGSGVTSREAIDAKVASLRDR